MNYSSFEQGFKSGDSAFTYSRRKQDKTKDLDFEKYALRIASRTESEKPTRLFGKEIPQPKVGAILVTKDVVYCSARSAYEIGNHAEHTAIETLASDKNLTEAVLYTTLEPCTAESRHEWTKSCSDLINDRKIKKVFMGTPDANPLVTGLGIKRLFDNDVDVRFFDVSQRKGLEDLNKEFFEFYDRCSDSKALKVIDSFLGDDIDWEVVSFYESKISASNPENDSPELRTLFYREMVEKHEILDGKTFLKADVMPSLALLFFKDPTKIVPGYRVNLFKEGGQNRIVFRKSLLRVISPYFWDEENIFYRLFPILDRGYFNRGGSPDEVGKEMKRIFVEPEAGRELLTNAIIHNDFSICPSISFYCKKGYLDCLDCCPVGEKDVGLMNEGGMVSFPTNPRIMDVFEKCLLVEASGLGMSSVEGNTNGLPFGEDKGDRKTFAFKEYKNQTFVETKIALKRL